MPSQTLNSPLKLLRCAWRQRLGLTVRGGGVSGDPSKSRYGWMFHTTAPVFSSVILSGSQVAMYPFWASLNDCSSCQLSREAMAALRAIVIFEALFRLSVMFVSFVARFRHFLIFRFRVKRPHLSGVGMQDESSVERTWLSKWGAPLGETTS